MASAPSKLGIAAIILVALWVVAYWLTPAPTNPPLKIAIGSAPRHVIDQGQAQGPVEAGLSGVGGNAMAPGAPASQPGSTPGSEQRRSGPTTPYVLVDVEPSGEAENAKPQTGVVPPTFRKYVTREGDTFQRIAARFYGTTASWRVIAKSNPEVDPNKVKPGIELMLPVDPENIQGKVVGEDGRATTPAVIVPEHGAFTEYVVQRGDTLSDIAKSLYGRSSLWQIIVDANPGVDPNRLRPGTTLMIPPPPGAE